jgi:hypothetical protein
MITAIIILIVIVIVIAAYLTYTLHKEDGDFLTTYPEYTKEELENIKLAEELYNKDYSKVKIAPELNVVEPEFVQKIVETTKVFPEDAIINLEEAVETLKPAKKKRKYYPKKKK